MQIQTPQAFDYELIRAAYDRLFSKEEYQNGVTDDAMVVESMTDCRVKMIPGDYRNIKITTPEDMVLAEAFFTERQKTC
ncbi:2-C-methyl-D-erythritol 4-phosphate cytidylyltransferase [Clostridium sp. AM58-1XD]|uniref:IspD/TarI family cytidylyltransferase n=1 Tax=Clostridium sp. AM58-1XD TaxID=2292307 RepID=UPI0026BEDF93